MTLQDMIDQFTIQGGFCIKTWDDAAEDYKIWAKGSDFEFRPYKLGKLLDAKIVYMYAIDGCLNIEIDMEV